MEQSHVVNFYQQMIHISIDRLQLVLEIKLKMRSERNTSLTSLLSIAVNWY